MIISEMGVKQKVPPPGDRKRVSLSVMPNLYDDAYVQRRSISDVVGNLMEELRRSLKCAEWHFLSVNRT